VVKRRNRRRWRGIENSLGLLYVDSTAHAVNDDDDDKTREEERGGEKRGDKWRQEEKRRW